jgi:uncharacterized YccA/Bax inhibitor family protein
MTIQGTAVKTLVLMLVVAGSAGYTWLQLQAGAIGNLPLLLMGSAIGALIFALIGIFKPTTSPYVAPLYAVLEGMVLGALSAMLNIQYPGLPLLAVGLTFGVAFAMLALYSARILQATPMMWKIVGTATLGIFLFYMLSMVLGFFGVNMPLIQSSGPMGIAFSLFVVGVAAFNLILDFGMIEEGARVGAPKYMEWYGALGLLITLVWLYIELLRLLRKLQR